MALELKRIQLWSRSLAAWNSNNPILLDGQAGIADANTSAPLLKVGDGTRPWSALPNLLAPVTVANDYVAGTVTTTPPGSTATVNINNTVDPPTISFTIPRGDVGPVGPTGPTGPVGPQGVPGPPNSLAIGTVSTGAPGSAASATITGTPPNQVLSMSIPRGDVGPQGIQGIQGPAGPANSLAVGTVTTGTPASATITGTPPNQTLSLVIPPGAPNNMSIGTVTTGAPGSAAAATITGTPPNQTLNLTIPQGPPGDAGTVLSSDSQVTGHWSHVPGQFFGFDTTEVNQLKTNSALAPIDLANDATDAER